MKVFIPSKKDPNPFLDEIINCSQHHFVFGDLESYDESFPVILINWPEQLFDWKEPSLAQLEHLKGKFLIWKKTAHIIYVVHDLERHSGMTANFSKLFALVIENSDSFIHLGNYSKELFRKKYPNKISVVISHPLYRKSFKKTDKIEARKILGIPKNKIVIIAPGRIRKKEERNFIIKAFKRLKCKNKVLVVPNMFYKRINLDFKGRTRLKKIIDIKAIVEFFYNYNFNTAYRFDYNFTSFEKLGLLMSASDIVIIPRLKILNSGNVFLALTYKRIFVGPNQGNVFEQLEQLGLPVFDPNKEDSVHLALKEAVNLYKKGNYIFNEDFLENLFPKKIAEKWDAFIESIEQC